MYVCVVNDTQRECCKCIIFFRVYIYCPCPCPCSYTNKCIHSIEMSGISGHARYPSHTNSSLGISSGMFMLYAIPLWIHFPIVKHPIAYEICFVSFFFILPCYSTFFPVFWQSKCIGYTHGTLEDEKQNDFHFSSQLRGKRQTC